MLSVQNGAVHTAVRGFQLVEKGIRFADAIEEWGPLIAHVSQSETVQFAYGKREVPKPA